MVKFVVLLLFCSMSMFGQELDKRFFLLGTLSDFRIIGNPHTENDVDSYQIYEESFADTLYKMYKKEYPDLELYIDRPRRDIRLKSDLLVKELSQFYEFSDMYTGKICGDIFQNKNQLFSFIAGAYVRRGSIKNEDVIMMGRMFSKMEGYLKQPAMKEDTHIIRAKACSKTDILYEKLLDLNCEDVAYYDTNTMPNNHTVAFRPTTEIKVLLNQYEGLRAIITEGLNQWVKMKEEELKKRNPRK